MTKILQFPGGKPLQNEDQPLDEFLRENFDPSKMEGVKGLACALLMEDGEVEFVMTNLSWAEVLWCAARLAAFAMGEEEGEEE